MSQSLPSHLRDIAGKLARGALRLVRPSPTIDVALGTELLRLPKGVGDEQCIAEIEEHFRGGKSRKTPCAGIPKLHGPFG